MNKEKFLLRLYGGLSSLPPETRRELIADYEDHFRSGLEHGKSEEEIAFELGSPEELAQEALELQSPGRESYASHSDASFRQDRRPYAEAGSKKKSSFSTVRLIMLVFWSLLAIPLWIAGWAVAAALAAAVLAFLAGPLLFSADLALNRSWNIAEFYAVLLLLGVGILLVGPVMRLIRKFALSTGRYIAWNGDFVMGRNKK